MLINFFSRYKLVLLISFTLFNLTPQAHTDSNSSWYNLSQEWLIMLNAPTNTTWNNYLLGLGWIASIGVALKYDTTGYNKIQKQRNDWQDCCMPYITQLGDGKLQLASFSLLYTLGSEYEQKVAKQAVEGLINVGIISLISKGIFRATRPSVNRNQRYWFEPSFKHTSFPSGHTMTAFCSAVILGQAYSIEWLTLPLATLVAYSRIYNKRHWPSDVIAGAGLGIFIGYTVVHFHNNKTNPKLISWHDNDNIYAGLNWEF